MLCGYLVPLGHSRPHCPVPAPTVSLANRHFDNLAQQRKEIDKAFDGKHGHLTG